MTFGTCLPGFPTRAGRTLSFAISSVAPWVMLSLDGKRGAMPGEKKHAAELAAGVAHGIVAGHQARALSSAVRPFLAATES